MKISLDNIIDNRLINGSVQTCCKVSKAAFKSLLTLSVVFPVVIGAYHSLKGYHINLISVPREGVPDKADSFSVRLLSALNLISDFILGYKFLWDQENLWTVSYGSYEQINRMDIPHLSPEKKHLLLSRPDARNILTNEQIISILNELRVDEVESLIQYAQGINFYELAPDLSIDLVSTLLNYTGPNFLNIAHLFPVLSANQINDIYDNERVRQDEWVPFLQSDQVLELLRGREEEEKTAILRQLERETVLRLIVDHELPLNDVIPTLTLEQAAFVLNRLPGFFREIIGLMTSNQIQQMLTHHLLLADRIVSALSIEQIQAVLALETRTSNVIFRNLTGDQVNQLIEEEPDEDLVWNASDELRAELHDHISDNDFSKFLLYIHYNKNRIYRFGNVYLRSDKTGIPFPFQIEIPEGAASPNEMVVIAHYKNLTPGGHYVSKISLGRGGFKDIRKSFYFTIGERELKPAATGVPLRMKAAVATEEERNAADAEIEKEEGFMRRLNGVAHGILKHIGGMRYQQKGTGLVKRNIVMEFATSDLSALIGAGPITPENRRRYFIRMLQGLTDFHADGHAHLDIKPGNILMINGEPKLADFGISKPIGLSFARPLCTPGFQSPEFLQMLVPGATHFNINPKMDVFALGIVFYKMKYGVYPEFYEASRSMFMLPFIFPLPRVQEAMINFSVAFREREKDAEGEIIRNMLRYNLGNRLSAAQALDQFRALA